MIYLYISSLDGSVVGFPRDSIANIADLSCKYRKKDWPGNVYESFKSWNVVKPLLSMISASVRIPHLVHWEYGPF